MGTKDKKNKTDKNGGSPYQMEAYEHGGNLQKIFKTENPQELNGVLDFSSNINPLGFPGEIKFSLLNQLNSISRYPDPDSSAFLMAAAKRYQVRPENILPVNGASEAFFTLINILPPKKVILVTPSYSDYERAAKSADRAVEYYELKEAQNFALNTQDFSNYLKEKSQGPEQEEGAIVIFGQPNNPTGSITPPDDLLGLIHQFPQHFFIIDEAFMDFVEPALNNRLAGVILPNLITVLSLTKMYAIAGLRAGLAIGHQQWIQKAKSRQSSWPLNNLAQEAGVLALQDVSFAEKSRQFVGQEKQYLLSGLSKISGLKVFPSKANFLLIKIHEPHEPEELFEFLLKQKILLRKCENFKGLSKYFFRLAVLGRQDNDSLLFYLNQFFNKEKTAEFPAGFHQKKKKPALMILGTGSNVGKSLMATALCRIFFKEGFKVYPFKAQNMSLNSCVTAKGHEMSRAQHLQALAARVEPDVMMNPVLLKPVNKASSQIILMGKATGNQSYGDYRRQKEKIWQSITSAYDKLSADADLMILEGAGSPVEMNLKNDEVVNMRMAEYAGAKALLVGNINYGGIFASFAGTLMLLSPAERSRIIGLVINQFRGNAGLFLEGQKLLEEICQTKVLGTIPFSENLRLPDEDSLAFSERWSKKSGPKSLRISVIKLPHISNFTDLDPFYGQSEVEVDFIDRPPETTSGQKPDALILPGSKNVMEDMAWLNASGLSGYIKHLRQNGQTEIVGLCGGFQILGDTIEDPQGIESGRQKIDGLGILNIRTRLGTDKILKKVSCRHQPSGIKVSGYEIHHGQTEGGERVIMESTSAELKNIITGCAAKDGMTWGTYLHGIFDDDQFRQWFLNGLLSRKNQPALSSLNPYHLESAIEDFANSVAQHLDLDFIRQAIGL